MTSLKVHLFTTVGPRTRAETEQALMRYLSGCHAVSTKTPQTTSHPPGSGFLLRAFRRRSGSGAGECPGRPEGSQALQPVFLLHLLLPSSFSSLQRLAARRWSTAAATCGAEAARPASRSAHSRQRCRSRSARATAFVRMSAGFSSPATLCKVKSPARSRSWTHNWLTAKWRTRPMPLLDCGGRVGVETDLQVHA